MDPAVGDRGVRGATTCAASAPRSGVALVATVLLGAALLLLAHAGVLIGLALERAGQGDVRGAEIDAHLDTRLRSLPAELATLDDSLDEGLGGRRLSPELLRVRADSAGRTGVATLWLADAGTRLAALGAGVRAGGVTPGSADRILRAPVDSCGAGVAVPPGFADLDVAPWPADGPLAIGPIGPADWGDPAPPPPAGAPAPGGWFVDVDSALGSGTWTGVLLVHGDLELRAGASVSGWVAVSGDLAVVDGASIHGVARVGGTVRVDPGGTIGVAPCDAVALLRSVPRFALPVIVGPPAWPGDARD